MNEANLKLSHLQMLVVSYLPIMLIWDYLIVAYASYNAMAVWRGVFTSLYLLVLLLNTNMQRRFIRSVWYFCLYVIFLLFFADYVLYSITVSSKVILSMLSIVIGYHYINDAASMRALSKSLFFCALILLLNYSLATFVGIGKRTYSLDLELGITSSWFVYTYLVILAPLYYMHERSRLKIIVFGLMLSIMLVLVLVSFKRAAILGIVFGYAVFMYYYRKKVRAVKYVSVFLLALVLLSPIYVDILSTQFEARSSRFEEGALESEMRYQETPLVWGYIFSFEDPLVSIFGLNPFQTSGRYGGGGFGQRMLHVDYNAILLSLGIVGFLLYMLVYYNLAIGSGGLRRRVLSNEYCIYQGLFWAILLTSLFTSLSGGISSVTFRSLIFLFLGALLRSMERERMSIKGSYIIRDKSTKAMARAS